MNPMIKFASCCERTHIFERFVNLVIIFMNLQTNGKEQEKVISAFISPVFIIN